MHIECVERVRCIESVALQKWFSTFHSQPLFINKSTPTALPRGRSQLLFRCLSPADPSTAGENPDRVDRSVGEKVGG